MTMVLLFFGAALLVATLQAQYLYTLRALTSPVRKLAGGVLIVVGLWMLMLGLGADLFARLFPV